MDQDTAQVLFEEGATFIFQDVPEGTEFGIDYNSWDVGPQFRGIKMIPPGLHFVYYNSRNKAGETAPRTGFFHNFKKKEILLRKWDKSTEDISESEIDDVELERYRHNLKELDQFLGPYPYEGYKKWISLSNYMTSDLVDKLQPLNGKIAAVTEYVSEKSDSKSRRESNSQSDSMADTDDEVMDQSNSESPKSKLPSKSDILAESEPKSLQDAESRLPDLKIKAETVIRFSEIPKRRFPAGSTPAEMTKYSMDSSYAFKTVLSQSYSSDSNGILGEIQFAFICLLIGQVYDAFEQWKSLVHLLCTSEEAINQYTDLYQHFITVLHFQVQEIPEDFFVDIVSQNNFLTTTLQEFFSHLENGSGEKTLRKKGLKFREHLTQKFKWDFTSEPDDFAPVIVDLN